MSTGLSERLQQHSQQGLTRHRQIVNQHDTGTVGCDIGTLINFSSNDYLGLANDPRVIRAFCDSAQRYGVGAKGSALIYGYQYPHQALEAAFAEFIQKPRALLFNSGFMANLGMITTLASQDHLLLLDKYNHASLIDGVRHSGATFKRYRHQDMTHLSHLITKQSQQSCLVISDGVFSMDGTITPLPQLIALTKQHQAMLIIDDAHGIGVLGKNGRGTIEHYEAEVDDIAMISCPLGKAFGCAGAVVAGSATLIESLIQFSRPYIYTTAIPPAIASAALCSLQIIQQEPHRREKIAELIAYFQYQANQLGLNFQASDTPIQLYPVTGNREVMQLSDQLQQAGFLCYPVRPPTIPKNTNRLRINLSYHHSKAQIYQLLTTLATLDR